MILEQALKISDSKLWHLLKAGDDGGYRYLYKNYYPAMCAAAYSYTKDESVSEALVDDVIFHIWQSRDRLDISSSLKRYLLVSVRNKCLEYLRSAAVSRRESIMDCDDNRYHKSLDGGAEEYVIGKELYELLLKAIGELPEETRKVFELSRYEGYTYDEIAGELGISVNTVKYHIKKALSILRTQFSEYTLAILLLLLASTPPLGKTAVDTCHEDTHPGSQNICRVIFR